MSDEQLAREHAQLVREQGLLSMPFLNEDLPFLAEFDGCPEVSVEEALEIIQTENNDTTTITAAETEFGNKHDMGAFNAPEAGFEELIDYGPPTSIAAETDPDMDMQSFVAGCDADENSTNASTSSSAATSSTTAPDAGSFKKSCKVCATRKVKCEIITGSNPRLCKYCQEKGLACEFELKKSRQNAQSEEDQHGGQSESIQQSLWTMKPINPSNPIMCLAKRLISLPPLLTRAPKAPLRPLP
ncbi:hypothetical protein KCU86_g71, partial [Aureobasidium melanogenum]